MHEVEDEPLFAERVAGIDIAKAEVMVTIRVPADSGSGRRQQETRAFRAVRQDLLALADWLRCWQVTRAGMEATSDYWKPVYFLLEREGFDCQLYHAGQVKALPGRPKTDKLDSVWLAKITERGALPSSFVPPEEIRALRTHTRYRRNLTRLRTSEKQRAEKLLEDAHVKVSSVLTDIHGVSGRDIMAHLIAGERDPRTLAALARGRARAKTAQLEQALDCSSFTEQHAFILGMMLANIDHLTAQISELTARIEDLCQPWLRQVEQLAAIPGHGVITAQDVIGEIGTDMTVFPDGAHLASWARWVPQVTSSGGKRKGSNATGRGNPYLGAAVGEAVIASTRTSTFLSAKYHRLAKRMPKRKAQRAIGNTMFHIYHDLLSDPEARYTDPGPDYYEQQAGIRRQARNHARALERLGYKVTLEAIDPASGELLPQAS